MEIRLFLIFLFSRFNFHFLRFRSLFLLLILLSLFNLTFTVSSSNSLSGTQNSQSIFFDIFHLNFSLEILKKFRGSVTPNFKSSGNFQTRNDSSHESWFQSKSDHINQRIPIPIKGENISTNDILDFHVSFTGQQSENRISSS